MNLSQIRFFERTLLLIYITTIVFCINGCTQIRLTASQSNNGVSEFTPEEKDKYPQTGKITIYKCFYTDKLWTDWNPEKSIKGVGLYEVRYYNNMFFALTSVLSLGILVPQGVEWELQEVHLENPDEQEWDGKKETEEINVRG